MPERTPPTQTLLLGGPPVCVQDRTEEEEQKPEANYLIAERPTGWHSR